MSVPPEKIIELARKAGFEAELKAASLLSKAGWRPNQNVYYIDKDEGKGRELDIYAYRGFQHLGDKPEVTCWINLCIEVKRTSEPFVFFTNDPYSFEPGSGYGMFHWSNKLDYHVLSFKDIERMRPDRSPKRFARSYASLKDGKTQHIQSGVLSAVKAAVHYKEQCSEVYSDTSRDLCFFIPIVIVDGSIIECFFDSHSAELSVNEVDTIVYMQNYLSQNYGSISNRVYVMTPAAFKSHLPAYRKWGEDMLKTMKKQRNLFQG